MTATALAGPRFVRRTRLGANEYHRNFHQIDHDVLAAVTSAEADRVTPLMSKIYLRLVSAPAEFWEREGVLYFSAGEEGGRPVKASKVLYGLLGVASATAHKALGWMHEQGIVGYFAGKNGAGIRIFLNRAAGSIGMRAASAGKKFLPFTRGSNEEGGGSANEPAFNDSYAVSESLDTDINPHAPKSGTGTQPVGKTFSTPTLLSDLVKQPAGQLVTSIVPVEEIIERLRRELEPRLKEAAAYAAAQSAAREIVRTREWFETKALPKAVRVAQHETYDLLRKHGEVSGRCGTGSAGLKVGRATVKCEISSAQPLTQEEVRETAEVCLALLETQGKSIEATLSEISSEEGGWLLPEDAPRVREAARELLLAEGKGK
jgi:hypothetical protein